MKKGNFLMLFGVILAMFLSSLDQTIVSTAMPQIVRDLNGLSHLSWLFTAYMLASTITVPIYGKLSDIYGRRGLYLLGIGIFLTGSILSGMSHTMAQLILFRALQGIGGGAMMVNSFAIIADIFPPAERGKWQGVIGAVFGLSSVAGPFLGGWITDNLSWHWVFYVNIPIGILALAVLASALPKITHQKKVSIDFLGAVLLSFGLVALLLGLVWGGSEYAWQSWQILSLFSFALIMLSVFVLVELKAKDPILPPSLFKNRVFLVSVLAIFFTSLGMFGATLYIPLFAQGVVGFSATNAGEIMIPMMLSFVVASALGGQFISRRGTYKALAIFGMFVAILGMFFFSRIGIQTNKLSLMFNMIILGLGLGVTMPIFTIAVQSAFNHSKLGQVTASTQLFRSIGGTVGAAVFGGVMNSELTGRLANIQKEPFLQAASQSGSSFGLDKIDMNALQSLLLPSGQSAVKNLFSGAPASTQQQMSVNFDHLIYSLRMAFSQSIDALFLVGTLLMIIAFIIVFFLPQIPLRKTHRPVLEEVGVELEEELGQADKVHEPEV